MKHLALMLSSALALHAAGKPEDELAAHIRMLAGTSFPSDWASVEQLSQTKWSPLPPNSLPNCLADGSCFARQGAALFGPARMVVMATGARTVVANVYYRNGGAAIGEQAVLDALRTAGVTTQLARCPLPGTAGGTNWYKLSGTNLAPSVLSVQTSCNGKPCEGFVFSRGVKLPALQPNQLTMYTEQCSASTPASERTPVSSKPPQQLLAETIAALVPSASGPAAIEWKALLASPSTGIKWLSGTPQGTTRTGSLALAGRESSILATGTATHVKNIQIEESGMHPRGEHVLGALYTLGLAGKLARCGPVYTESTNNWYSLTGAAIHPAMIRQSIRYDGNRVQDAYELRLDATLPARDARDRDPGVNGCR